jgi:hypothetical protein
MQPNPEKRSCLSIIVCDDVYRDETTKKLVIVGAFNQIFATEFPCTHRKMVVLFTLTNGRGRYDFSLAIEHEETGEHVVDISGPMQVDNPLRIADVTITTALSVGELEVDGVATFRDATMSSSALDGLPGRVAKVLSGIHDFDLAATVSGPFTSPEIKLRSNLDSKLKDVLGGQLKEKRAELEQKLKSRLNGEIDRVAGPYQDRLKAITQNENTLDQRMAMLDEMLKAEISSVADTKKEALKDDLKDKLKGLKF